MVQVDEYYLENLKYRIEKLKEANYKLHKELNKTLRDKDHAEFRIKTELEPRIKAEEIRYDFWVSQQTGERECDHFCSTIDELTDFVKKERPEFFEWEETENDLYAMILFLIKNQEDINIYSIEEKE